MESEARASGRQGSRERDRLQLNVQPRPDDAVRHHALALSIALRDSFRSVELLSPDSQQADSPQGTSDQRRSELLLLFYLPFAVLADQPAVDQHQRQETQCEAGLLLPDDWPDPANEG
jgi:hypothetical protein